MSWPVQKILIGNFSNIPFVNQLNNNFLNFYKNKNAGRTLNWHLPYCSAEISAKLNNQVFNIELNGTQLLVLMLFNQPLNKLNINLGFSLQKIIDLLKVDKDELQYSISGLINNWHILKEENVLKNELFVL